MRKVVIVDDSATCRANLRIAVERDPGLLVVGEAKDRQEALFLIERAQPHVVTMDVYLEHENGLEVAREIMHTSPRPIVVVSSASSRDASLSYKALEVGALDILSKPPSLLASSYPDYCKTLGRRLKALSLVPVLHGSRTPRARTAQVKPRHVSSEEKPKSRVSQVREDPRLRSAQVLLWGASTGGPTLLRDILNDLPRPFPIPIVVAQHISAGFGLGLASWLQETTGHQTCAVDRPRDLSSGKVFVAPDDRNLVFLNKTCVAPAHVGLGTTIWPNIDVLFESAALHFEERAIACLFTGMGRDGAEGLLDLRRRGALTVAQVPESCVVDGMPRAALSRDAAELTLSPADIVELFLGINVH